MKNVLTNLGSYQMSFVALASSAVYCDGRTLLSYTIASYLSAYVRLEICLPRNVSDADFRSLKPRYGSAI